MKEKADKIVADAPVFLSFHLCPEDTKDLKSAVGYAFTMTADVAPGKNANYPKKSDASSIQIPGVSAVPNHAYALATSPSRGDLEKLAKKQGELVSQIKYFEKIIDATPDWISNGEATDNDICDEYPQYCKKENYEVIETTMGISGPVELTRKVFAYDKESKFHKDYLDYLRKKKEYMETFILIPFENKIQKNINNRNELIKERNNVQKLIMQNEVDINKSISNSGTTWLDLWNMLHVNFSGIYKLALEEGIDAQGQGSYDLADPSKGTIANIATMSVRQEAFEKVLNKIKSAINNVNPQKLDTNRPLNCQDPVTITQLTNPSTPTTPATSNSENNCAEIKIAPPSTFLELTKMIKYYPKKADFSFAAALTDKKQRFSLDKTKIHAAEGFQASKFEYVARAMGSGNPRPTRLVPDGPEIWACLGQKVSDSWTFASIDSGYYPIKATDGIRACQAPKTKGIAAYASGLSLHAFGLAFDIDPPITGQSTLGEPVASVFTGAWTPSIMKQNAKRLYELGVFDLHPDILIENAFEGPNLPRLVEHWAGAPSSIWTLDNHTR